MSEPVTVPYARAGGPAGSHYPVTVGSKGGCPVRWRDRHAVVALPGHVDVFNASQIGEQLLSVRNYGARVLIADMTATNSCDHASADVMAHVYRCALVTGTQLRLVVTVQAVRRMLALNGLDQLIPVYPSLEAAAAAAPATAVSATSELGVPHAAQGSGPDRATVEGAGMATFFGRPGLDWTVVLRRQPGRIIAGRAEGGYTNMLEIICCDCGDDPGLDYREVSAEVQRIRGPYQLAAGVAAYEKHLRRHPNRQEIPRPADGREDRHTRTVLPRQKDLDQPSRSWGTSRRPTSRARAIAWLRVEAPSLR